MEEIVFVNTKKNKFKKGKNNEYFILNSRIKSKNYNYP